MQELYPGRRVS